MTELRQPRLLTITGPTACGKTRLAVGLALRLDGEIISADSRQVFRGMDIGTGKDLSDYTVGDRQVPYHLIDIHDPGYEYNVYQFQVDFVEAYHKIVASGHTPILCGGTGFYVESVVKGYDLPNAPIDPEYRKTLEDKTDEELTERLAGYIKLHNHTDTETRERLVRALEIQEYRLKHPDDVLKMPQMEHLIIGVQYPREKVVERIGVRLRQRLEEGMVDEVKRLLDNGIDPERLMRYGLEYRYVTLYVIGQMSYDQMYEKLYTEIRRFSKRQMTWFRHMERGGTTIHWVDGQRPLEQNIDEVASLYLNH